MLQPVFGRERELQLLRGKLQQRRSFLLHGPSGVGKSLLLHSLLPEFPSLLACADSSGPHAVFCSLTLALAAKRDPLLLSHLGMAPESALRKKTASALRGIVLAVLKQARYQCVLDSPGFVAQPFAAHIRQIAEVAPLVVIARSVHMEDLGFLLPLFPGRADRFELRNFSPPVALEFAQNSAGRIGLQAGNLEAFLEYVAEVSAGNPGTIAAMVAMAQQPRYRRAGNILSNPLYIDLRLGWSAMPA